MWCLIKDVASFARLRYIESNMESNNDLVFIIDGTNCCFDY